MVGQYYKTYLPLVYRIKGDNLLVYIMYGGQYWWIFNKQYKFN